MKPEYYVKPGEMRQTVNNDWIDQMYFRSNEQTCTLLYKDGHSVTVKIAFCSVYSYNYGMPPSMDGKYLYVGNWDWKDGLVAYHIPSGEVAWRLKKGGIRDIFVFSEFIVVRSHDKGLLKVDAKTGTLLKEMKGSFRSSFMLDNQQIIAFQEGSGRGKVFDMEHETIVKIYPPKIVNPNNCLSIWVESIRLENNILAISGRERHTNGQINEKQEMIPFDRIIDATFSTVD